MAVSQRGKNRNWYYRFKINGKEYYKCCKGATDRKEALQYESIVKGEIMRGNLNILDDKKVTSLKEAIKLYLDYSKTNKRSHQLDKNYCKVFEEEFGCTTDISDITPQKIETFKTKMRKGRSNATVNRYLEAMSKMYNLCADYGLIEHNPLKRVSKLRQDNQKTRILNEDEQKRIFEVLDKEYPDLRDVVICALQTGLRRGEIFILKWKDINFKERYINAFRPKTHSYTKIHITDKLLKVFESRKGNKSEYVFVNLHTGKPYTNMDKAFRKLKVKAEIEEKLCFHDLRHTVATRMVANGIDLVVVKDILGHSSINTTMRYAHPMPEVRKKAVDVLNSY
jgi:integrase